MGVLVFTSQECPSRFVSSLINLCKQHYTALNCQQLLLHFLMQGHLSYLLYARSYCAMQVSSDSNSRKLMASNANSLQKLEKAIPHLKHFLNNGLLISATSMVCVLVKKSSSNTSRTIFDPSYHPPLSKTFSRTISKL